MYLVFDRISQGSFATPKSNHLLSISLTLMSNQSSVCTTELLCFKGEYQISVKVFFLQLVTIGDFDE